VLEPAQPLAHQPEASFVDAVHADATLLFVPHEPGVFQDSQVPRRRRPLVRKSSGDFAGGRGPTKVDRQKNLSPRRVRQRGDDRIEGRELLGRL
jgi:hypothetical protein